MNQQFTYYLEWEETKLAMNANNKLELVTEPLIIQKQVLTDDDQIIEGSLTIDNKKDHDFQNEFKKMINNNYPSNKKSIKYHSNQKDRIEKSITQISSSIISQDILPNEIKQNKQDIQNFGDKKLFLIIKGEGFLEFRIRSISFKLQCPQCKEYFTSFINKIQLNIIQFQSDCKKCQQQMNIVYQKQIQQQQSINLSQWLIGSIKIYGNIQWQLNAIKVSVICKCLSNNSRLPYLVFSFEKTKKIISQTERQKCQIIDQTRQLCHGCVQELKFQPEWLIIKQ
ncbi:unnamed protein product [Paramecium pentaurelia]|uniref:Uncharacterized protein n=1 Tax=Paramecium pentaurelia TaxID=43138 RepID=A0A8S1SV09_9CILI|nr:unnamed protein product [Paramecium pentaurelia]